MITALSPLDGRYEKKVEALAPYFSEYALIKYRLIVEVAYFMFLSSEKGIPELPAFTDAELKILNSLIATFTPLEAERIKTIEKNTNHDVKAVEYYLKEKLEKTSLKKHVEFIHFACTSEDINNLAYALMLKGAMEEVMLLALEKVLQAIREAAQKWRKTPMLSMTHGQPASPTTVGKEFLVFQKGVEGQLTQLKKQEYCGKLNGATGNFNAHVVAYPKLNWIALSKKFIQNLGLTPSLYTTQIEPHDFLANIFDNLKRINVVLLDLDRDMWLYISRGVFKQKLKEDEVGSSTMPHKVNPIDFENSEGNLGIANALLSHFAEKLPVSRMQRDLSDSTVERNIGVALGHSLLAYESTLKGLQKLELNAAMLTKELNDNWALLAEPIQTVMRKHKVPNAYEQLKALTRGKEINEKTIRAFIHTLKIPADDKDRLLKLTPETYIGLADKI